MRQTHGHTSFVSRPAFRLAGCLLAGGLLLFVTGCFQQILTLGYLIGGPPSIEPDFDRDTKHSMTAKDVKVAVVCFAPKDLKWDTSDLDEDIAKYVSYRLSGKKVKVIRPGWIKAWLDKNPEWDKPDEIGAEFKATYVINIELEDFKLYEKGNQNLYRGRAEVNVTVWEMDLEAGEGSIMYRKQLTSVYPLAIGKPTSEITYSRFKRRYLERLSEEIGRLFYEHYNGDDIQDAT